MIAMNHRIKINEWHPAGWNSVTLSMHFLISWGPYSDKMSGYVNHEKCNPPKLLASFGTSSCSLEKLHEASCVHSLPKGRLVSGRHHIAKLHGFFFFLQTLFISAQSFEAWSQALRYTRWREQTTPVLAICLIFPNKRFGELAFVETR